MNCSITLKKPENKKVSLEVFSSVNELTEDWNSILPQAHHLHSANLSVFEESNLKDFEYRYLLIKKNKQPAALVYIQVLHFKKYHYQSISSGSAIIEKIEDTILNKNFKIFATGNFLRVNFPGIFILDDILSLKEVLDLIDQYLCSLKSSERPTLFILKDLDINRKQGEALEKNGYRLFPEDITMELHIKKEWKTINDYLSALTKKYVQRAKKTQQAFEGVIRKELSIEEIIQHKETIEDLYHQIISAQTIRLGIIDINYILACKKNNPEKFKVFAYFLNEKMIAFTTNIIYEHKWEVHYIGIDKSLNQSLKIYHNLLLYGIKDAIENGKEILELGRTAREAKAICGCKPSYFINYYKVNGTIAKMVFRLLEKNFKDNEGDEWKKRNPFKEVKLVTENIL